MTKEERITRQCAFDRLYSISVELDTVPWLPVLGEPNSGHGGSAYYRKLEEAQGLIDEVLASLEFDLAEH